MSNSSRKKILNQKRKIVMARKKTPHHKQVQQEEIASAPETLPIDEEVSGNAENATPVDVEQLFKKIKMEITLSDESTINKEIVFSGKEAIETTVKAPAESKMPWTAVAILAFIVCASLATGIYHWISSYYGQPDTIDPGHVIQGPGPATTPDIRTGQEPTSEDRKDPDDIGKEDEDEPAPGRRHYIDPPPEFLQLWEEYGNEDIVATLTLGDTEILVVQGTDNAFYITHDIHRNLSLQGWVFLDHQVNLYIGLEDNMVIFDPVGEFLRQVIQEFADYDYFLRNPVIMLSSLYGDFEWEIFSYYIAPSDFPFAVVNHPDEETWGEVVEQFALASLYNTMLDVAEYDQVLTIAVPTTVNPELFYILQARMLRQITS